MKSYLDTLLVDFEERGTHGIVGTALKEFICKPCIEAGVVLLLQFVTVLTNTVHCMCKIWTELY